MKDEDIARLRLRRQHLTGTPLSTPEAVGGWLGAAELEETRVHVQLWRPLDAATRSALEHELERYGRFLQRSVRLVMTRGKRAAPALMRSRR